MSGGYRHEPETAKAFDWEALAAVLCCLAIWGGFLYLIGGWLA